jgi:hypothetical protein
MENFIYLLILIAWIVFALYRQSQKKKAAVKPTTSKPGMRDEAQPFKSLGEILFGQSMQDMQMMPVEEEPDFSSRQEGISIEPFSPEETYMESGQERVEKRMPEKPGKTNETILKEEGSSDLKSGEKRGNPLENFDLRKAVIYSEILRRPYD